MKANWCAAVAAVLMLSGCTGASAADTSPSPSAVVDEAVPMGYFRKPKDGEVCKKVDLAPLQAVLPGIAVGPASGVFQNYLKCDYTVAGSSVLGVAFRATMFDSAAQAAKQLEIIRNSTANVRTVTLPASKAEVLVTDRDLGVTEQNMALSGGAYSTDKAVLTEAVLEAVRQTFDALLVILRKEFQSTTGPSPSAEPKAQRRVASPAAVNGRQLNNDEPQFDEIQYALLFDLDDLDESPTVAATYGASKSGNVMVFAATLAEVKKEASIEGVLSSLETSGITMSKPTTDKADVYTEIRCGEAKLKDATGALCLWRDYRSIGVAAFPGQKPAAVKADFLILRQLATAG